MAGLATLGTVAGGLSARDAAARLERDGPNVVPETFHRSVWWDLLRQLTHLLALLLWVAVGLALLAGMPNLSVAIAVIIVVNAGFAFGQEYRADRSTQRLRALLPRDTRVLRDGRQTTVPADQVVVDDVVLLGPGDRVPADLRVLEAHELELDESLVTGESGGVVRRTGDALLGGTFLAQGEAVAVVTATGSSTALAGIANLAGSARRPASPLATQLHRVVRTVAVLAGASGILLGGTALVLGLDARHAFLFGVGVTVALVPEGLLPTVTLSLARGAQLMAGRQALVRRLDAVETLGATTFICTDKTGTLTQNKMAVVEVSTPAGVALVRGEGYEPVAAVEGPEEARATVSAVAAAAVACVQGRAVPGPGGWVAAGDPMEAALHALSLRVGAAPPPPTIRRRPYTADRMLSSALDEGRVSVIGAPEAVFDRCEHVPEGMRAELARLTGTGHRVLAVATRLWEGTETGPDMEWGLGLVALLGLEDPPRPDVPNALEACRSAEIRVAMITGDHPSTARSVALEVGLLREDGIVLTGAELPHDDAELATLLDRPGGAVVARVSPADKFRIARVLRERGHVVAMTGDGVNDAPALREADVGVAMGAGGSDVTREAADLVLLNDDFSAIVAAVELGRATFLNVRRFLTYHLTDNVAELAPFVVWALSGSSVPLAIGVLQVLALDVGTDLLPAIGLGAESPHGRIMQGPARRSVVDRRLLLRALGVLGLAEATLALLAFLVVLAHGGWSPGLAPSPTLLATASGTAFASISLGQMANAFICRSATRPAWRLPLLGNRLLAGAVLCELVLMLAFLGVPAVSGQLGGGWPSPLGWVLAFLSPVVLVLIDATVKHLVRAQPRGRRRPRDRAASSAVA